MAEILGVVASGISVVQIAEAAELSVARPGSMKCRDN
jgi:hypothetical protein